MQAPFTYRPSSSDAEASALNERTCRYLLGVDWGHIHDDRNIIKVQTDAGEPVARVVANTGMMGVVPAWKLDELLNEEELVIQRKKAEADHLKKKSPAAFDVATSPGLSSAEEFEKALKLASLKISPPDGERKGE